MKEKGVETEGKVEREGSSEGWRGAGRREG